MSDNESLNASSATKDGAARKAERYAHGRWMIAKACAEAICDDVQYRVIMYPKGGQPLQKIEMHQKIAERIANTLDAIHETLHEAGSRSS